MASTATKKEIAATGMIPTRDEKTEAWLKDRNVTFTYESDFPLNQIDMEASLRNQARVTVEPLSTEFVTSYAQAMTNGSTFPPIVVWKSGKNSWTVIDGNHRVAAAIQLGWTELPAYVVETLDSKTITLLTYEANAKHGIPTTPGERLQQAMHLIDAGVTGIDASRLLGVSYTNLTNRHRALRTKRHLSGLGVDTTGMSDTVLQRLGGIHNDAVVKSVADLVKKTGMRSTSLNDLSVRINAERTEDAQMAIVDAEWEKRKGEIGQMAGFVRMPNSVRRWASVIGQVQSLQMSNEDAAKLTDEYRKNLYDRAKDAQENLDRLVKVLR